MSAIDPRRINTSEIRINPADNLEAGSIILTGDLKLKIYDGSTPGGTALSANTGDVTFGGPNIGLSTGNTVFVDAAVSVKGQINYLNSSNVAVVRQVYNSSTNSLDTVFI